MLMFDLHCHSIFSDGELIPSELVRRVEVMGYQAIAITDHADHSNLHHILDGIKEAAKALNPYMSTKLIPGIELTHVPPELIAPLASEARQMGAKIIVCHGETVAEPVKLGTNQAALEADIDILAHPGFITAEQAKLAAERGIFLEISARKGHCITNGHVAKLARTHGAAMIIDSDGHAPGDFMTPEYARKVGIGAGIEPDTVEKMYSRAWEWLTEMGKTAA